MSSSLWGRLVRSRTWALSSIAKWGNERCSMEVWRRRKVLTGRTFGARWLCLSAASPIFMVEVWKELHMISTHVLDLQSQDGVGVLVIDIDRDKDKTRLGKLSSSLCAVADIIPIMLIQESDASALARPEAKLATFPCWSLQC